MTRRATFNEADLARAIRAARKAGLKVGEFTVEVIGDKVSVLTRAATEPLPSADQEGDAWAGAMAKWRRSA